jgi:hypothetical protein
VFRIDMLPAGNGDGLWIEYGEDPEQPHRVLIDGGTGRTRQVLARRIEALPADRRRFELLVVTHIDGDHILGVLRYLEAGPAVELELGDFWFNAWRHLPQTVEPLGPVDGERLTTWLDEHDVAWNDAFQGERIALPDDGALPRTTLPGGLELTLLSPGLEQLRRLVPVWAPAVTEAGLDPETPRPPQPELPGPLEPLGALDVETLAATPFDGDAAEANGSSIVLLAEFEGKAVLLGADAHAAVVGPAIDRLLAEREVDRLELAAFKVSHHGSKANVSSELLARLRCSRFLFSTNGVRTHHPNQEAVARVLLAAEKPATLSFNYRSPENEVWDDVDLRERCDYRTEYAADEPGLAVEL